MPIPNTEASISEFIDPSSEFGERVVQRLKNEQVIWLTTVGADLTPQPRPVWFVWDKDSFLIFSQPHAHKVRHVTAHPQVALQFNTDETGDKDVIIFVGTAAIDATVRASSVCNAASDDVWRPARSLRAWARACADRKDRCML